MSDTTHITKEGLLQALNEYEFERPSSRKWILARAAELSAQDASPKDAPFQDAWYEIAYLLGIGAQNASPKEVHDNQVMPRLRALREMEAASPKDGLRESLDRVQKLHSKVSAENVRLRSQRDEDSFDGGIND